MSTQDYTDIQNTTEPQNPAEEVTEQTQAEAQASDISIEALQAQLATLAAGYESAKEQVLRAQADAQNARRRAEQDVEKAHKFGLEKMVNDLLPVVDNLERALASIDAGNEVLTAIVEGIQLTHKSFVDALARHQVIAVDPVGEPFDPNLHQAVSAVPNPDVEPNTVINCFQKGYTLHGRLVRPAMVVVSKAP
ncbi:nucleotide exchange factor GrpE [Cellvibrio sp. UBA7661]|uniref:nucleotide exchange factor GrpE n=1 Tax=Cellvibrio sp. UBA7661 TaxID=1946311 RepID=UPI002F35456B